MLIGLANAAHAVEPRHGDSKSGFASAQCEAVHTRSSSLGLGQSEALSRRQPQFVHRYGTTCTRGSVNARTKRLVFLGARPQSPGRKIRLATRTASRRTLGRVSETG